MFGWQVRDADRRVGHVDVLSAGAARTIGVDPKVFLVDLEVDVLGKLGPHEDRCERRVAPLVLIEWRDPHQAMHARLGGHQSVGVVAGERHGHALDTGLLARLEVEDLALEAATLPPFRVHAQEHLGPVLRFGAAGAGMDTDDRVRSIVFAAEHLLGFGRLHFALQLVEPALEVGADVFPAVRPIR